MKSFAIFFLKSFFKKILSLEERIFFEDISRNLNKLFRIYFKNSTFASNNLDIKLKKYLNYRNGFYIELGANNGILASNTYHLQKKLNWKGLLIEPCFNLFIEALRNRGSCNTILNYACVSFNEKREILELDYADSMTVSRDIRSDLKSIDKHLDMAKNYLKDNQKIEKIYCKTSTLNDLLLKSKAPLAIDFLSLDTEGSELEILKGIDFNVFSFYYILIESRDIFEIKQFLKQFNYELIEKLTIHDFLFKKAIE